MELLPAIDILDGKAVRLAKGDYAAVTVYNENPVEQAKLFESQGVRWLHVVDLDGARTGMPANAAVIEAILAQTGLKVEAGGGIRSLQAIERLVQAGASRVVLGTALVDNPQFAADALERYGSMLVAGIDAKQGEVAVEGWCEGSGIAASELIASMGAQGFRHLVYTDIARDGMQTGIDAQHYVQAAQLFGSPVIASGGVANLDDIVALSQVAEYIEGVIAGRAVYEGSLDISAALEICAQTRVQAVVPNTSASAGEGGGAC